MAASIRSLIRTQIAQNPVMIFSKSYCPYCLEVKELFTNISVPFQALEIDEHDQGTEIQEDLKRISKQSTVPNVYIKGNHVGGCDATLAANESGLLREYLNRDHWTEIPEK